MKSSPPASLSYSPGVPQDLPRPLLGGLGGDGLAGGDGDPPLSLVLVGLGGDGLPCPGSSSTWPSSPWNSSSRIIGPPDDPELPEDDELDPSTVTHLAPLDGPGGDDLVLVVLATLGAAMAG